METELHQNELVDTTPTQGVLAFKSAGTENLLLLPPASEPETQWKRWGRKASQFLAQLPEYVSSFFQQYKQPLLTVALILSAIVTVKVVLALLSAINEIPLLSPTFELVGISYVTWVIFRYLIKASTRQELAAEIQAFKQQFVGEKGSKSFS
jgi:hypothetical protein